uniref:Uncharacterized protein n=1 Tax=viral metagenome TaxID=1070528 RepID=A0A6M3XV78_9ZZZZ
MQVTRNAKQIYYNNSKKQIVQKLNKLGIKTQGTKIQVSWILASAEYYSKICRGSYCDVSNIRL